MILAIDIGNSNIKLGVFDGDELVHTLRLASSNKTGDEYWLLVKDMLAVKDIAPDRIEGAVIGSVNPNLNYTFEHMVGTYFGFKPLTVGSGIRTGLPVKYDNPKELGADRVADCVAAVNLYGAPLIVIDCGTATSFNVISKEGVLLGGAISFGLKASAEALSAGAARLPKVELSKPKTAIGRTTITNMQSGIVFGYAGLVEAMVRRLKSESGLANAKVVATGGISDVVNSCVDIIDVVDRTLTLRGLNILYRINRGEGAAKK